MIKLVASDLDGTLLNDDKRPPAGFTDAVRELYRHGIRFALASGREYASIIRIFHELEDILLVITDNGALNYDKGKMVYDNGLLLPDIRNVYDAVSALPDVDIVISGEFAGYYSEKLKGGLMEELIRLSGTPDQVKALFQASSDPLTASTCGKIGKLAFYHREDAWRACEDALKPFMDQFQIFPSEPRWVNLMRKDVSKGLGIRQFQQYLGVTPNECIAFGDYLNDCSMFREVRHTYAVANAHEDLKMMAENLAPSNNDDGVLRILCREFDFLRRMPEKQ